MPSNHCSEHSYCIFGNQTSSFSLGKHGSYCLSGREQNQEGSLTPNSYIMHASAVIIRTTKVSNGLCLHTLRWLPYSIGY